MLISKLKEVNHIDQHTVLGSTLKEKVLFSWLVLIFFVWGWAGKYSQGPWKWGWVTKAHIFRVFESLSWPHQPLLRGEKEKPGSSSPHVAWHRRKCRCRKEKPLAQDCTVGQQFFTWLNCSWLMPYLSPPLMLGGHLSLLVCYRTTMGNVYSSLNLQVAWQVLSLVGKRVSPFIAFGPSGHWWTRISSCGLILWCTKKTQPSKNCSLWLFP